MGAIVPDIVNTEELPSAITLGGVQMNLVDELPVITNPGLVHAVFFLAIGIINLPAVPRVCQEEQITRLERLAAPRIASDTAWAVAARVKSSVLDENFCFFARACMSLASASQAVSWPSHPS
jgi:hypothetical protein